MLITSGVKGLTFHVNFLELIRCFCLKFVFVCLFLIF